SAWGWLGSYLKPVLTVKPVVRNNCNACGTCVNVCLQGAIRIEKQRAKIDDNRCIRCYCCQESCPNQAIGLKSSISNKIVSKIAKTRFYRIFEEMYHIIKSQK
ncbi:MAG: 4Fe-4S binding protein, partial [bacterium]